MQLTLCSIRSKASAIRMALVDRLRNALTIKSKIKHSTIHPIEIDNPNHT